MEKKWFQQFFGIDLEEFCWIYDDKNKKRAYMQWKWVAEAVWTGGGWEKLSYVHRLHSSAQKTQPQRKRGPPESFILRRVSSASFLPSSSVWALNPGEGGCCPLLAKKKTNSLFPYRLHQLVEQPAVKENIRWLFCSL